ncbi:DUF4304 domain-containing protein [Halovulum sp. GXIMD14794]
MPNADPFARLEPVEIDVVASQRGFRRRGQRNWTRRTPDFVQLVNLQHSQWDAQTRYLNFAMWALALGEPPSVAESKVHFRTRAESLGARDLSDLFRIADGLRTLNDLGIALREKRVSGLCSRHLQNLLALE